MVLSQFTYLQIYAGSADIQAYQHSHDTGQCLKTHHKETHINHFWKHRNLTGWPSSLSLFFNENIFWSWSANSTKRSSCSFLESVMSTSSLIFSFCKMAMVLLDESSCSLIAVLSSDRALISHHVYRWNEKIFWCHHKSFIHSRYIQFSMTAINSSISLCFIHSFRCS